MVQPIPRDVKLWAEKAGFNTCAAVAECVKQTAHRVDFPPAPGMLEAPYPKLIPKRQDGSFVIAFQNNPYEHFRMASSVGAATATHNYLTN